MICQRCLQRLAARRKPIPSSSSTSSTTTTTKISTTRPFTHSSRNPSQQTAVDPSPPPPTDPVPRTSKGAPAALSVPAVAQPFSTPLTPKPNTAELPISRNPKTTATATPTAAKQTPRSSVLAGTVLKGLNFMKNKPDPVAGEDGEYPGWLWGILEGAGKKEGEGSSAGDVDGDLFAKSKKQRQRAAKALRKQQALHPESLVPKVPLYEQSIDLPAGDGTVEGAMQAGEARGGLNQSMRGMRRKKIKEDNFLRGMG
ncbi:hypothetical protein LTR78_004711 [Recurvomyces mirabilis]|uniref:Large ribosomal subunit protein mL54 n=1 Tax=Recurvomyces mirabilis TaxID=574656 RepID=A0AAE0WPT6_9PEZI|nr:hypothetical protein LTR78_004711 [Recurvomyces mirabilis]KAK5152795.1 hypothetical protein LTS14_007902 [Recurvomyces mirabilis]